MGRIWDVEAALSELTGQPERVVRRHAEYLRSAGHLPPRPIKRRGRGGRDLPPATCREVAAVLLAVVSQRGPAAAPEMVDQIKAAEFFAEIAVLPKTGALMPLTAGPGIAGFMGGAFDWIAAFIALARLKRLGTRGSITLSFYDRLPPSFRFEEREPNGACVAMYFEWPQIQRQDLEMKFRADALEHVGGYQVSIPYHYLNKIAEKLGAPSADEHAGLVQMVELAQAGYKKAHDAVQFMGTRGGFYPCDDGVAIRVGDGREIKIANKTPYFELEAMAIEHGFLDRLAVTTPNEALALILEMGRWTQSTEPTAAESAPSMDGGAQ